MSKLAYLKKDLLKTKIYEDKNILVINKPTNLPVQGGSKVKISVDQILNSGDDKIKYRLTHRIDKDTSGVLILAKTEAAAREITKAFKDKTIHKTYLAIVIGKPKKRRGVIDMPIYDKEKNTRKPAKTEYEIIDNVGKALSFMALHPITGRKHQLRIHLTEIGHPILGDGKYGGRAAFIRNLRNKIHLHSYQTEIRNLFGKKINLKAELPKEYKATMDELGFNELLLDI